MFNFNEEVSATSTPVNSNQVGWFINANYEGWTPSFGASIKSKITDGAWDTLLERIQEAGKLDALSFTVTSINLSKSLNQEVVVDAELDKLLNTGVELTPLFEAKKKDKEPAFAWINLELSSKYIKGDPISCSVEVPVNAPRKLLSTLLRESKTDTPKLTVNVSGVVNPRVKKEFELLEIDF